MIQVYTSDTYHDDEEVEEFYAQIEEELDNVDEGNIVTVMGNFNSKVGSNNKGYADIIGRYGLGESNERGTRMLEFCQQNELRITNTCFCHRVQHRYTWTSPNHLHKNCIEYILVKRRWRSSVLSMKVMGGEDLNSPHELLLTNIKIKFKGNGGNKQRTTRFNINKLRSEEVKDTFRVRVCGGFESLKHEADNMDELCRRGRDILQVEAENILERKRNTKQPWMTEETLEACDEKGIAISRKNIHPSEENKSNYRENCREVERNVSKLRNDGWQNNANHMKKV